MAEPEDDEDDNRTAEQRAADFEKRATYDNPDQVTWIIGGKEVPASEVLATLEKMKQEQNPPTVHIHPPEEDE